MEYTRIRFKPDGLDVQARTKLMEMYGVLGTWESVTQTVGYKDRGLVYRVAHGKRRAPNALLKALEMDTRATYPRRKYHEADNERLTIRLSPSLSARIVEQSAAQGITRAEWAREILARACGLMPRE